MSGESWIVASVQEALARLLASTAQAVAESSV